MKFSKYILLTEDHAQPISNNDAENIIRTKCTLVDKNNINIYRGTPTHTDYLFGSGEFSKPRTSANTSNYTTLLIDNSPLWNAYPKRSKSYICTTSETMARQYGTKYKVYPYDTANIGIAPNDDFWFSFNRLKEVANNHNISNFNDLLGHIFFYLYNRQQRNDQSFDNIKAACIAVDKYLENIDYDYSKLPNDFTMREKIIIKSLTHDKNSMLSVIMNCLAPQLNGFKQATLSQLTTLPENVEVWTDSPCIFKRY